MQCCSLLKHLVHIGTIRLYRVNGHVQIHHRNRSVKLGTNEVLRSCIALVGDYSHQRQAIEISSEHSKLLHFI
jgi:hypothetical protein